MTELVSLDGAERMLAEASTLDEIMDVRARAEAMRRFAAARLGREQTNYAAEIKLRAERKAGEVLHDMDKNPGGNPSHDVRGLVPTLADLGITYMQSSRWQQVAVIDEAIFERYIAEVKASPDGDLTTVGLIAEARTPRGDYSRPDLPPGSYRTIVIDPPWPMERIERTARPMQPGTLDYPTMTLEEIKGKWRDGLAAPDGCHVYLWFAHKYLPAALDCFKAWGVDYQCLMTWVKPTGMTPYSWMYNTEHVLFGHVGSLPLNVLGRRLSFEAPVVRHSQKPDVFYELVRDVSPEPRLDMYARGPHDGFEAWGNETDG